MDQDNKFKYTMVELGHHLPYSIFGVMSALIMMGVCTFMAILLGAEGLLGKASFKLFHIFHPAHILFSAVATTAMFWKYEHRIFKAVVVGFIGSVGICALSDIYFPFVGGFFLGIPMDLHVCAIEEPGLIYPFAVIGVLAGLLVTDAFDHSTQYAHSVHMFVSSVASLLYLMAFGLQDWIHFIGGVFLVTIVSVMIPCCLSDIVFPLACTKTVQKIHDH